MKKNLFLLATAALALAACSNDLKVDENTAPVGSNVQKEIAFTTYAQGPKHVKSYAPVAGTTFTSTTMEVAAWDVTNSRDFFGATTFTKDNESGTWKGGMYWPMAPTTINFLAYANLTAGSATWDITDDETSQKANGVVLEMGDNKTAQNDLMYACGTGAVTQTGNMLTFPTNVPMVFKHAQAWIQFTVKAGDAASASAITVNSITLNSVSCQGTYTVTHTNYNAASDQSVAGVWTAYAGNAGAVAAVAADGYSALSTSVQEYANLMVIPNQGIASFTINYTVDEKDYEYTYTPASTTLAQATKYIYNITLTLHEIEIAPSITDWTDGGSTYVDVPAISYAYNAGASAGSYAVVAEAGTYTIYVTGLGTSDAVSAEETGGNDYIDGDISATNTAGTVKLVFKMKANEGATRSTTITLSNTTASTSTTITINQAAAD